jgi:hypothetical protein
MSLSTPLHEIRLIFRFFAFRDIYRLALSG